MDISVQSVSVFGSAMNFCRFIFRSSNTFLERHMFVLDQC